MHTRSPSANCNRPASVTVFSSMIKMYTIKTPNHTQNCFYTKKNNERIEKSPACGFHNTRSDIKQPILFAKKIPSPESFRPEIIVGPSVTILSLKRFDGGVLIQEAIQFEFQRLAIAFKLFGDARQAEQGRAEIVTQR